MASGEILIVDDTPGNLDLLIDILEKHGMAVRVARNGRRALLAVEASQPDLVMLDIQMPEMDGFEVCRQLKGSPSTSDIPIVFLSVHDDVAEKVAAFRVGGADYITKPFQAEEVLARVENQLKISRLQRELVLKREEALEASRAKSAFLANMSHELRTPLNGILGFVQLLENDKTLSAEQHERIAVITRSGEHLLGLINDVLSLSKIEAGQGHVNDRPFDLGRLLLGLEEMFNIRAESRGLELECTVSDAIPPHVLGDDGKLRQILINLLGNAFKFTEEGKVSLVVRWNDGVGYFEVADTGPGISPADMERVFEPFVQTELGKKSGEGTGLGLTISRNYVRLMGGELRLESELGKGSVFRFDMRLPAVARQNGDDLAAAARVREAMPIAQARVSNLPSELRGRLQASVNTGDREAAFSVAEEVAARDVALADELKALIKAYRFDEILELLAE